MSILIKMDRLKRLFSNHLSKERRKSKVSNSSIISHATESNSGVIIYTTVRDTEYLIAINELLKYLPNNKALIGYDRIINFPSFKIFEYQIRGKLKRNYYYYVEFREPINFLKNGESIDLLIIQDNEETPVHLYYEMMDILNAEMKKIIEYNKTALVYKKRQITETDGEDDYLTNTSQGLSLYYYKDNCIKEENKEEETKKILNIKINNNDYEIEVSKVGNGCYKTDFNEVIEIYKDALIKKYQKIYQL